MSKTYFQQVHEKTPTRFWVNNPTPLESEAAIAAGTEYCTTNPTYTAKMLKNPETAAAVSRILAEVVGEESDDSIAASIIQSRTVKMIMDVFMGVYEASGKKRGWVSIQGDPEKEDDPAEILREAEYNIKLAPNYIAKVPVTVSGLKAIAELSRSSVPVIATEVMSLSQAVNACEVYTEAVKNLKNPAPIYVTHITGIFDQCLGAWQKENQIKISDDVLWWAGILAGRKQYQVIKERGYPVVMLGGGARGLHHFTEFVGADMHITINWKGTADKLIEANPPVELKFNDKISESITEVLLSKVPMFKAAWEEDGLSAVEYKEFPPVELFRSMFLDGWTELKNAVKGYRNEK